jgi:CRISPR-associated protein Cmr5
MEEQKMLTRNQAIASDVFLKVSSHNKDKSKKQKEEYKSMAEKFPVLVQTAGLAQALSFIEVKAMDNEMHKKLLSDLCATLKRPNLCNDSRNTQNLQEYLHLTRQVMLHLLWYKRFAKSVLEV